MPHQDRIGQPSLLPQAGQDGQGTLHATRRQAQQEHGGLQRALGFHGVAGGRGVHLHGVVVKHVPRLLGEEGLKPHRQDR